MLRCGNLVLARRRAYAPPPRRMWVTTAATAAARRSPPFGVAGFSCFQERRTSARCITVQQQQRNSSIGVSQLAQRPQQHPPQPRVRMILQRPTLIPATQPISSVSSAAPVTPPSFSSLMMHHHHQQHHYHPSNREAALAFAALLKTLRLPFQRLVPSSHPVVEATAAQSPLSTLLHNVHLVDEESMFEHNAEEEDACWKAVAEEEDAFLQLQQAPVLASIPSFAASASSSRPQVAGWMEVEKANSFISRKNEIIFASSSAVVMEEEEEEDQFDDDDNKNNNNISKIRQEQQKQQQPSSSKNKNNSIINKTSLLEAQGRILHYIGKLNVARALQVFYDTVDSQQQQQQQVLLQGQQIQPSSPQHAQRELEPEEFLSINAVKQLFFLVSKKQRPFDSYRVLLYYQRAVRHHHAAQQQQAKEQQQQQQHDVVMTMDAVSSGVLSKQENNNNYTLYDVGMYERQCDVLRFLDPLVHSYNDIEGLVRRVIADVMHKLDSGGGGRVPITANDVSTTATTTTRKRGSTSGQERCIPILVSALAQQRTVRLGRHFCPKLYQHMMDHSFDVSAGYLEHLLGFSKFHRQEDLPFPSILHKAVVEMNRRVEPVTVLNVVENLFPYTDMDNVKYALESLIHLVKMENISNSRTNVRAGEKNTTTSASSNTRYKVDISTLEAMGAAAAKEGATNVCLLIWDLFDVLNYNVAPSVMIYENTVIAFCQAGPSFYPNVFVLLQEMQSRHGYAPSRALIRGLSTRFRYSHENLDAALDAFLATMTMTTAKGTDIVLEDSLPHHSVNAIAGLNAILAARAERGDLDHALELLDRIQTSDKDDNNSDNDAIDVVANADTYGFLFEALGKHLVIKRRQLQHRRDRQQQHHHRHHHEEDDNNDEEMLLQKCWHCANSFLTIMENQGIAPSTHMLREYIELLCQMNDVSTATAIVRETIQSSNDNTSSCGNDDDGQQPLIGNKTLYRVAVANAQAQNFDVAREIAEMASVYNHEPMPFLVQKISIMERADAVQDNDNQDRAHMVAKTFD